LRVCKEKRRPLWISGLRWLSGLADAELGAAAIVDPEAAVIDTPGLALNAG
jgi:hypothetical protein